MLRVRSPWRPVWAIVSGAAAAVLLFAAGLFASGGLGGLADSWRPRPPVVVSDAQPPDELAALRQRIAALELAADAREASALEAVTRPELEQELRVLFDHHEDQRAADMSYVLQTVAASEQRMDRNAQALTYLALRESPWVAEH